MWYVRPADSVCWSVRLTSRRVLWVITYIVAANTQGLNRLLGYSYVRQVLRDAPPGSTTALQLSLVRRPDTPIPGASVELGFDGKPTPPRDLAGEYRVRPQRLLHIFCRSLL